MSLAELYVNIERMPFYWRLKAIDEECPVPEILPFCFDYDLRLKLITQKRNIDVLRCLENVYSQDENIGYLQDGNTIAKPYGDDFYRFITEALSYSRSVRAVLEIGCGGCTVLRRLQLTGYDVIGIDPGPLALREGARLGIPVIKDFFPTSKFTKSVDLIFHNDVLEHVEDPVNFLRLQRSQLRERGLLVVGVPDCSDSIATGDISLAMHQHLNYFNKRSLRNVLVDAGFEVLKIQKAAYGGSLYALAQVGRGSARQGIDQDGTEFVEFLSKAHIAVSKFSTLFQECLLTNDSIGFYAPLRAIPYLASIGAFSGYRFFDDTGHWHGKYFDGIRVKVENFADLQTNPVDRIFVMSSTFGNKIINKICDAHIPLKSIYSLDRLISHSSHG